MALVVAALSYGLVEKTFAAAQKQIYPYRVESVQWIEYIFYNYGKIRGNQSQLTFGERSILHPEENDMPKITPFLWFDNQAEEAVNYYTSIFKNSKILSVTRYGDEGPGPKGQVMTIGFQLEGQNFTALNGGPEYQFNPAISFYVDCKTQEEVDELWARLTAGGQEVQCGWLVDKFGVSWQIIPGILIELLQDKDPVKAGKVMQAMLQMKKIDIRALQQAYTQA